MPVPITVSARTNGHPDNLLNILRRWSHALMMITISKPRPRPRQRRLITATNQIDFSRRAWSLASKAVLARSVREESKAAPAIVAARLGSQHADSDDRVACARAREKVRVALLRASRPGTMYGEAVKEANLRGANGGRLKSRDPLRCVRGLPLSQSCEGA